MKLQNKNQIARTIHGFAQMLGGLICAFIIIGASFSNTKAQSAGSLDPTFGTGGKVTTAISTDDVSVGYASARQSNGRLVVAGSTKNITTTNTDFFVARYLEDGSLDNSFGKGGKTTISFNTSQIEKAVAVIIQPDGKIVVVGITLTSANWDFALIRLNSSGTPDISFGTEGKVITDFSGGSFDQATGAAIDSSNRIVVVGRKAESSSSLDNTIMARYNTDGSLDASFGTGGKVIIDISGVTQADGANGVVIQPSDGKIVVVGNVTNSGFKPFTARFLTNGAIDTGFGTSGKVIADYAGTVGSANAVAIDPLDQGIITASFIRYTATGQEVFAFFRYTSAGVADLSFGADGNGAATMPFGALTNRLNDILIEPDGKIVAAGYSLTVIGEYFALARLERNGLPDSTFGSFGKTTTFIGGDAQAFGIERQTDGKIIAVGYGRITAAGKFGIAVARYNTNGVLDASFGFDGNGIVQTAVGSFDYAGKIIIQTDGKILVGGATDESRTSFYTDFVLTRYNPNGTLDTTFGTGGKVQTDFVGGSDGIGALAIQPDGKIVAGGWSSLGSKYDYALARYNANGSLDTTFGDGGKVRIDFLSDNEFLRDLAIQADGKIVAVGEDTDFFPSSAADFITLRFKSDGGIDSTFGANGIVRTDFGLVRGDYSNAVTIQTDGKIVVAGDTTTASGLSDFAVVRYDSNGALDTTFDADGKLGIPFASVSSGANDVAIGADGNLILAGSAGLGNEIDFALVRVKPDGSLDATFDGDGRATVNFDTSLSGAFKNAAPSAVSNDAAYAVVIQTDGKIVATGKTGIGETSDFALARLNYDGSPDSSFDTDGKTTTNLGKYDFVSSAAIQTDGKVVVAGYTENFSDTDFAVARYTGFAPTAANASLSGRVTTADGRGISNARLTLVDGAGIAHYASTGSFGYYLFEDLPTGATYILTVSAKRFAFAQPTVVINLTEDLADINFISEP